MDSNAATSSLAVVGYTYDNPLRNMSSSTDYSPFIVLYTIFTNQITWGQYLNNVNNDYLVGVSFSTNGSYVVAHFASA